MNIRNETLQINSDRARTPQGRVFPLANQSYFGGIGGPSGLGTMTDGNWPIGMLPDSTLSIVGPGAFSFSAVSVGTPVRCPLSISAFLTQSCSVCGVQPILAAIEVTAAHREGCSLA